jgi:hypothetical protein
MTPSPQTPASVVVVVVTPPSEMFEQSVIAGAGALWAANDPATSLTTAAPVKMAQFRSAPIVMRTATDPDGSVSGSPASFPVILIVFPCRSVIERNDEKASGAPPSLNERRAGTLAYAVHPGTPEPPGAGSGTPVGDAGAKSSTRSPFEPPIDGSFGLPSVGKRKVGSFETKASFSRPLDVRLRTSFVAAMGRSAASDEVATRATRTRIGQDIRRMKPSFGTTSTRRRVPGSTKKRWRSEPAIHRPGRHAEPSIATARAAARGSRRTNQTVRPIAWLARAVGDQVIAAD